MITVTLGTVSGAPRPPQLTSLNTRLQDRPRPWPVWVSGLISSFESQFPQGQTEKTELFNVHSGSPRRRHRSGTRHLPGTPRLAEVVLTDRQCSAIGAVATVRAKAFSERQGTVDPSGPQRAEVLHSGPVCKRTYLTATLASHSPVDFGNFFIWILQKLT